VTVTVYFPKDLSLLRRAIAEVHAEAVAKQIEHLACPVEQKDAILQAVKDRAQQEAGAAENIKRAVA
jgi:hypothetical protein